MPSFLTMHPLVALCVLALTTLLLCEARTVTLSNVVERRDTSGAIMDVHDGNSFIMNGVYYLYGASYGLCTEPAGDSGCTGAAPGACGFRFDHNVSLWTSVDLVNWNPQPQPVFQMAQSGIPSGILFCPKVIYNARTQQFVLWFNWIEGADFSKSFYAVAVSSAPNGPFQIVNKNVSTLAYADTGDFDLFVDDNDQAYIIYTAHIVGFDRTHRMSVEQLTDDYLETRGPAANSGFFGADFVEAPTLFKRDGVYYALFGSCCCYCQEGSDVYVHTALHPLGPYTTQNSITLPRRASALASPSSAPRHSRQSALLTGQWRHGADATLRPHVDAGRVSIPAQQTGIFPYRLPADRDGTDSAFGFLWRGDRWQSAPDRIKAHDFTYFGPLQFTADGNVTALVFQDQFSLQIA